MSIGPPDIKLDDERGSKQGNLQEGTSTEELEEPAPATQTATLIHEPAALPTIASSKTATKQEREITQEEHKMTEEKLESTEQNSKATEEYIPVTMESLQTQEPATIALGLIFGYVAVGVGFYSYMTAWSPFEAFYFVVVTLTSVGYGDFVPTGDDVRLFTAFYILLGVGILGTALGEVVSSLLNVDATPAGRIIKWLSGGSQQTVERGEGGDATLGGENQSEMDQLLGGESAQATLVNTLISVSGCLALGSVAFYCLEP